MPRSFGLDYETGWDMAHDPQMRPASEGDGICLWCGGVYPLSELERNGGLCPPCYYASIEPDPDDGELFESDPEECSNECGFYYNCKGGCGCGTHEPCRHAKRQGGSADGGKR